MEKTAEAKCLEEARVQRTPWKKWGPYLSERQWGTVREDYSTDGKCLGVLPARLGALASLPLGRGRTRSNFRREPESLFRALPMQWQRSHPERTPFRTDEMAKETTAKMSKSTTSIWTARQRIPT